MDKNIRYYWDIAMDKNIRYYWDITEEEIELLKEVGLPPDLGVRLREVIDYQSKRVYLQETDEFLAKQAYKIRNEMNPHKVLELMWEVVKWKENYKSPFKVD